MDHRLKLQDFSQPLKEQLSKSKVGLMVIFWLKHCGIFPQPTKRGSVLNFLVNTNSVQRSSLLHCM